MQTLPPTNRILSRMVPSKLQAILGRDWRYNVSCLIVNDWQGSGGVPLQFGLAVFEYAFQFSALVTKALQVLPFALSVLAVSESALFQHLLHVLQCSVGASMLRKNFAFANFQPHFVDRCSRGWAMPSVSTTCQVFDARFMTKSEGVLRNCLLTLWISVCTIALVQPSSVWMSRSKAATRSSNWWASKSGRVLLWSWDICCFTWSKISVKLAPVLDCSYNWVILHSGAACA